MITSDAARSPFDGQISARELQRQPETEQAHKGYLHTLREICQQPVTVIDTCERVIRAAGIRTWLKGVRSVILTGSGSSEYVGDCVRLALQSDLGVPVEVVGGGALLTHSRQALLPIRPAVMISIARSGNSPESAGALELLLEREPEITHIVITCNAEGALATRFLLHPRVHVLALDERTNDQSLVMTSSFTAMTMAVRGLALLNDAARYGDLGRQASSVITDILENHFDEIAAVAQSSFYRVVYLASGDCIGAARESALKMLEMTAGRVSTVSETYLGLRHGPMSYVHPDTLVVCFLSSDPAIRAYETDLIRELDRKHLGMSKLLVGNAIPPDLVSSADTPIECRGLAEMGGQIAPVVYVVVGQLLGFFRCLKEGLRPDAPSADGVISRVVENFQLHPFGEDRR